MPLIDRLERKYGWIAIPGIVRILVGFQLLTFILFQFNPEIVKLLLLYPDLIMKGQVWRLVSFVMIPPTLTSLLGLFFGLWFMFFIGDVLESMWGSFRLTLYLIGGVVGILAASFIAHFMVSEIGFIYFSARVLSGRMIWVVSMLFAVAILHPQLTISIMGVIPIKMMWLGWIAAGILFLDMVTLARLNLWLVLSLVLAISNFLVVFGPSTVRMIRHSKEVAARRRKFEDAKLPEDAALHRCATCGKTEHEDPDLDFRVASDGEEYCAEHLPGRMTE